MRIRATGEGCRDVASAKIVSTAELLINPRLLSIAGREVALPKSRVCKPNHFEPRYSGFASAANFGLGGSTMPLAIRWRLINLVSISE